MLVKSESLHTAWYDLIGHYKGVIWAPWCLKSLATGLLIQQLGESNIKEKFKAPHYCFIGRIHRWPVILAHKYLYWRKCIRAQTSSCTKSVYVISFHFNWIMMTLFYLQEHILEYKRSNLTTPVFHNYLFYHCHFIYSSEIWIGFLSNFSINVRDTVSGFILPLCLKVALSFEIHQTNISFIHLHWNEAPGNIQGNLDGYGFDVSATSPPGKKFSPWADYAIATRFSLGGFAC